VGSVVVVQVDLVGSVVVVQVDLVGSVVVVHPHAADLPGPDFQLAAALAYQLAAALAYQLAAVAVAVDRPQRPVVRRLQLMTGVGTK
jgi:hypothetical protein